MYQRLWGISIAAAALLAAGSLAYAQSNPRYIQFTPNATKGALYVPDSGPAPRTAFLVIHRTSNFMNLIATRELAKRGFMVLGMNPRSDNNEAAVRFEEIALDIKQGIEFLKKQPGIGKVVLIGHSGGGPSTSFYQAVAEKGPSYCQGPNKLTECSNALTGLPAADAMVLLDAHPGNTVNTMRSLNGAVTDEAKPYELDASLNPFDPKNGFNPNGDSHYSDEFVDRFARAQAARMTRLVDKALKLREEMKAGKHAPSDDEAFIAYHNRARPDAGECQARRKLRRWNDVPHRQILPQRECDPGQALARRHRLVLEQQLDALRRRVNIGAALGRRHGRALFHPRR